MELEEEWWRWLEMKEGFWMRDFHFLETQVQVMMDLIGSCRKAWVRNSGGRESHIGSLSDIAACYCFPSERERREREGLGV